MSQSQDTQNQQTQLDDAATEPPRPVAEPAQPTIPTTQIATGGAQPVTEDVQFAPLEDLKDLYNEIKRIMDKALELEAPLAHFNDLMSILCARRVAQDGDTQEDRKNEQELAPAPEATVAETEETVRAGAESQQPSGQEGPRAQPKLNAQEKFIYEELIPGVASRLAKHAKTANVKFTQLVADSISGLVDLLIVELRAQTPTCCELLDALRPVFDYASPIHAHHYQKVLDFQPATSAAAANNPTTVRYTPAKADLSTFTPEEIEWRNGLAEGDLVDVVKHDLGFSVEAWSRGEVVGIIGAGTANLGDAGGDNVKKLNIKYVKDSGAGAKLFRADSPQLARFDTRTAGDEWRYNLQVGDEADALDSYGTWATVTVVKRDAEENNPLPMVTVGFRRYHPGGDHEDAMGKYFGKGQGYDQRLALYGIRVQRPRSVAQGADPDGQVVWRFRPATYSASSPNVTVPGGNPVAGTSPTSSTPLSTPPPAPGNSSSGYSTNKIQDERDMAMIKTEGQRVFATERYTCKSTFFVAQLNKFGEAGGFESILRLIVDPDVSLEHLCAMVGFFVKSHQMYHKQFVDAFYDRFRDAVEAKLLSATSAQLRAIKLARIEEVIAQVWQTLLLRRMSYFDLQVLKSQLTVKVGILFMKQTFLQKRIDGAKMIDQVCKRAVSEVGSATTVATGASNSSKNLLQELIDTLRAANVLELFFSSRLIHSQLVQRSDGLLKLLLTRQALSEEELDFVWNSCQRHESTALDLATALQSISYSIGARGLTFFVSKILAKPPSVVRGKEVELMLSLGRRTSATDQTLQENQARAVQFFWNYLFDEAALQYLDRGLATNALNALGELLRLGSVEVIVAYFGRLVENIRTQNRGYFSVIVASKFVRSFTGKGDLQKRTLVDSFQRDHELLNLLIQELSNYLAQVREQVEQLAKEEEEAGRSLAMDGLGDRVFSELFPHSTQLTDRMDFIKELAKVGSFQLSHQQVAQIWTDVIIQNKITGDHKAVSAWLQTICDDFLLGRDTSMIRYEDLADFFRQTIGADDNSFVHLNLEGYHCIQGFFLLVNLRADKLVVQDDDVARAAAGAEAKSWETAAIQHRKLDPDAIQVCAKVAPNVMEGIGVLWKIAIECQERRVGECVASMLLQVHTSVDFGLEDQITMFEDQFVESCMRIIGRQTDTIALRSPEERQRHSEAFARVYGGVATPAKLRKVLPVEEKRIIACLSYLRMLVLNSERDGMNGLIPHAALDLGAPLDEISVTSAYDGMCTNGFRSRFPIQTSSNATVYRLKQHICSALAVRQQADGSWAQVAIPHPWTIRLTRQASQTELRDKDNGKTLADLSFKPNEALMVRKKATQSVSKMPLLTADGKLNERAKFVFTQIFERYAIEDPADATQKVLMEEQAVQYVRGATGQADVAPGVQHIMSHDSNQDGKMSLADFLYFYERSCTSKLQTVRANLAHMGFRDDLQLMPPPGSPDNILQPRKTYQEMPRFKIAQDKATFESLLGLLDQQAEVSKEAQSLSKMVCTNQEIFWNILKLSDRADEEGPFSWDMVFHEDIKVTMYSLDIIDSIIKTPAAPAGSRESALRYNWVERFLMEGGFQQLLAQLNRALALPKEALVMQDYSSESSNVNKGFVDQMLRLMKTFIFAAVYADQAPSVAENPLLLRRHTSVSDKDKDKEKDKQKQKAKADTDEAQFQQSEGLSSVGGPAMPLYPPVTVGPAGPVYGPIPPPASSAGDSDGANIAPEDQAAIERAMKEGEDRPATTQITTSATQSNAAASGAQDGSEFEQTPRFKQIVEQIRHSSSAAALIAELNFQELQAKLLEILAMFLANRGNQSKEEGNIISSALSLWSAAAVQRHELIADFFAWTRTEPDPVGDEARISNATDFLLNGIYSPKGVFVRNQFKECIELICEKVTHSGERPLFYMIRVLMNHFPSPQSRVGTEKCSEYFSLFGALIKQYQELLATHPEEAEGASISIGDLLRESFTRLRDHESTERDSDASPDSTLGGLLILVKELLDCFFRQSEYDEAIEFARRHHLLHEFYYENLYYMPDRTTGVRNKCKTQKSRTSAYKLLYKLLNAFKPKEMAGFLEDYLWPMIQELSRPTAWRHQPSERQRSAVHKYAGINNLGNICYMISMLQQFFMVPTFRYQLLRAVDESPEDLKTYKERNVDDSLLRQFQRLFGYLELSERAAADPFDFCFAYKDLTGEPTNVGVQCDSQEFLTFFFDRMEDVLRPTSQKYLLQDVFRGTYVSQRVCESCGDTKNDLTTAYTLSVQVENTKDLYAGLSKLVQGDVIEDFACGACNQKVNIVKRQLLGAMPNVLIVHLQRIVFDFNTFGNKKVNSRLEFPRILELGKLAFKEHARGEVRGETVEATAELAKLTTIEDEDYVYRLVGVNIHRGVADSGHYWSMINTKRGRDEPDPVSDPAGWRASNETDWKKFDDETVESYNPGNLEKDAFGGDTSALTQDEQYIASTANGAWGRSAYMLIYEKKLKKPVREVVLDRGSEEEKVVHVETRDVEPHVPEWLRNMVQRDNTEFVIDRQVFNTQFFYLIKLVLKHISADLSMTQHQYPLEYAQYFNKMNSAALKIGQKVMFDFLSHYHENACLSHINDYMSTIFTFSDSWVGFVRKAEEPSVVCEWLQATLIDDQCTYFFHLMFNCPDPTARLYCGKLVAGVVNKGFRILAACEEKEEDRSHPKVLRLRSTLGGFMTLALEVIHTRECQKHWARLEQFYRMLEEICTGGKAQAEYLLARNDGSIVVDLCDLMLQRRSPKAQADTSGEPRVEMGGSASRPAFGPLVTILCHIVRCMPTLTIGEADTPSFMTFEDASDRDNPRQSVSLRVQLTEEALQYFTNADLRDIIMGGSEVEAYAEALAHVCYANKTLTKEICRLALRAIVLSDYNRLSQYLRVVQSQLALNDSDAKTGEPLRRRRLEWVLGFPYLSTGLQEGEKHEIGLEALHHDIGGEVYTYRSMLTHDPDNNNSLLHLLWRYRARMESYTMSCLNYLADIVTHSEDVMDFFSRLPGVTYQYARYSDWIQPFLMSQLNKSDGYSGGYSEGSSKEDIVKVISKFSTYDSYLREKDTQPDTADAPQTEILAAAGQIAPADEENKDTQAIPLRAAESAPKTTLPVNSAVLKSSPPAYIICRCSDENYLGVTEHDGVMLSMSYMRGRYVMSRPTGYTNLAVSAAFLASGAPRANVRLATPPASGPQNKSAAAMLEELNQQKQGGMNGGSYAQHGTAPLRVKTRPSESAANATQDSGSQDTERRDPPKIVVDGNDEWQAVNEDDGYRQDVEDQEAGEPQNSVSGQPQANQEEESKGEAVAPQDPQDREMQQIAASGAQLEIAREDFDSWTGDQMHTCDDLVYKLSVSNTMEQPILFKIDFKDQGEEVNLSWPLNGVKGSLAAGENTIAALLTKLRPGDDPAGGRFELEKLRVNLSWKPDVEKIARLEKANNNSVGGAASSGGSGAAPTRTADAAQYYNDTSMAAISAGKQNDGPVDEKTQQLMEMGFELEQSRQALQKANGNVEMALNYLF